MTIPPVQREVVAFLTGLAGAPPLETHISAVFRGAETVWKLKKSVRLSFLDFSSLAARQHFVAREFALNAPAAPGLYRDVAAVIRQPDGTLALTAAPAERTDILDWVLRMARVPEADFLERIAESGGLTPAMLDALGDAVAAYHQSLPPVAGIDPVAAMARVIAGNARAALDAGLPAARVAGWAAEARRQLALLAPQLRARAAQGFVRRAHGDLHLGNLCRWQGRIVPFDALEFDEALATIDLGYDLAFLLMDLDQRADRAAANRVLNRYVARNGDVGLTGLLPLFLSCRALIRAHVAARSGDQAAAYLDAAEYYPRPVPALLLAVGGLPGTGKSTLARAVAPALGRAPGALILRSDEIRKRLQGVAPETRLPEAAYAEAISTLVFAALADGARVAASGGQAVVADATFLDPAHRVLITEAARAAGVVFYGFWLRAPMEVLEQRIGARVADASDATVPVLRAVAARAAVAGDWIDIDATNAEAAVTRVREIVSGGAALC